MNIWTPICLLLLVVLNPATGRAAEKEPSPAAHRAYGFDDFLVVPLRVHFLSARKAEDFHTTLTEADLTRILGKMNGIWGQAGIHLYLESLVREEAVQQDIQSVFRKRRQLRMLLQIRPKGTRSREMLHLYYVKKLPVNGVYLGPAMFVMDEARLRKVPGGIDEPLPRVSSHEIGHAFRLPHRQARINLMASGTTGTNFNRMEIDQARLAASQLPWIHSARTLLDQANQALKEGNREQALEGYRHLQHLPIESPEITLIRKRLKTLEKAGPGE